MFCITKAEKNVHFFPGKITDRVMIKRILDLPVRIVGGGESSLTTSPIDIMANGTTQSYFP